MTNQPADLLRLRDAALEWRLVEGEVVALDLERSEYLAVNRSGAELWALLAHGATPAQLVDHLVDRHSLGADRAQSDVERFLAALAERRLLQT